MPNNVGGKWGFTQEEMDDIKRLVEISIRQGTPLDQMFPGEGPLQEAAAYLYLIAKGASFLFNTQPQAPDPRDLQLDWSDLPRPSAPEVDLRPFCSPIEYQGDIGSCSAQATVGALELLDKRNDGQYLDLSRLFQYYNARSLEGRNLTEDTGSTLRANVKAVSKFGVCKESIWPYIESKFSTKPSQAAYEDAKNFPKIQYLSVEDQSVQALKTVIAAGFPAIFGMWCYQSFVGISTMKDGVVKMPSRNEKNLGGHGVTTIGYSDRNKWFICRNSWGTVWGKGGFFFMPYEFYQNYTWDTWAIALAT